MNLKGVDARTHKIAVELSDEDYQRARAYLQDRDGQMPTKKDIEELAIYALRSWVWAADLEGEG